MLGLGEFLRAFKTDRKVRRDCFGAAAVVLMGYVLTVIAFCL